MEATNASNYTVQHPAIMASPTFMIVVLGLYLFVVTNIGPNFMLFRKPLQLRKLMIIHNIIQVIASIYVVYETLAVMDNSLLNLWKCKSIGESGERVRRHYKLAYFLFILKFSELLETLIFVLRNKQNQVTKLHVFHHISTITIVYLLINHNDIGYSALFAVVTNSFVHIAMYTYYLITAVADRNTVQALKPVKQFITVMQLIQFGLILVHGLYISATCGIDKYVFVYYNGVILLMFYGFYDFYKMAYMRSKNLVKSEERPKTVDGTVFEIK